LAEIRQTPKKLLLRAPAPHEGFPLTVLQSPDASFSTIIFPTNHHPKRNRYKDSYNRPTNSTVQEEPQIQDTPSSNVTRAYPLHLRCFTRARYATRGILRELTVIRRRVSEYRQTNHHQAYSPKPSKTQGLYEEPSRARFPMSLAVFPTISVPRTIPGRSAVTSSRLHKAGDSVSCPPG